MPNIIFPFANGVTRVANEEALACSDEGNLVGGLL